VNKLQESFPLEEQRGKVFVFLCGFAPQAGNCLSFTLDLL
jgi:hypothetical protein